MNVRAGRIFRRRGAAVLGLLVLSALAVWFWQSGNGLLNHAVLLVPAERWVGTERRNGDIANYTWLSNTEVLLFRRHSFRALSLERRKVLPPGRFTPAVSTGMPSLGSPESAALSPDHTTLHLRYHTPTAPRGARTRSEFVSLSDGRTLGSVNGWALGAWCEGLPATCELEYDRSLVATLHRFDTGRDTTIDIVSPTGAPLRRGSLWPLFVERSGRVVAMEDSYFDGIVTPAVIAQAGSQLSRVRTLLEFNLNRPRDISRRWSVPIPADAATFLCQASPTHDRLLWIVQSNRMSPLATLTQKLPAPLRQPARYGARWMVSDLEGGNMHTVAEFEISDLYFDRPDLISPQWTPDGKAVSFEYRGALYLLPVK